MPGRQLAGALAGGAGPVGDRARTGTLQADHRDELRDFLFSNGIGTLIQWGGKGVHQWDRLGFTAILPKTESFFNRCIMLPINMFISDDDIHQVCDSIISFYRP